VSIYVFLVSWLTVVMCLKPFFFVHLYSMFPDMYTQTPWRLHQQR